MEKQLKQIEARLKTINSIISKLDPAIKVAAFELLKSFITEGVSVDVIKDPQGNKGEDKEKLAGSVRDFYATFDPKKPADSAIILSGWLYTQRGSSPFTLTELEELFDELGVPRPAKLNMTLRASARKGKKLFQNAGRGSYRPTVPGENYFKQEMNIRPGKRLS